MAIKRTRGAGKRAGSSVNHPQSPQTGTNEPQLSRERIVAAAIDLLDAEGIGGLTMRRLADRLGSGVMSLYWHVDNKDDVSGMALDAVLEYRGAPTSTKPRGWRDEIIHLLEDWRASMLRHPWSASLLPRQVLGQNTLARLEVVSTTLSRAGVPDADLNAAVWSLWNYLMGATATLASFDLSDDDRAAAQERLQQMSGRHPAIERSGLLLDDDWDGVFRKGLDFLLDGLTGRQVR